MWAWEYAYTARSQCIASSRILPLLWHLVRLAICRASTCKTPCTSVAIFLVLLSKLHSALAFVFCGSGVSASDAGISYTHLCYVFFSRSPDATWNAARSAHGTDREDAYKQCINVFAHNYYRTLTACETSIANRTLCVCVVSASVSGKRFSERKVLQPICAYST